MLSSAISHPMVPQVQVIPKPLANTPLAADLAGPSFHALAAKAASPTASPATASPTPASATRPSPAPASTASAPSVQASNDEDDDDDRDDDHDGNEDGDTRALASAGGIPSSSSASSCDDSDHLAVTNSQKPADERRAPEHPMLGKGFAEPKVPSAPAVKSTITAAMLNVLNADTAAADSAPKAPAI